MMDGREIFGVVHTHTCRCCEKFVKKGGIGRQDAKLKPQVAVVVGRAVVDGI